MIPAAAAVITALSRVSRTALSSSLLCLAHQNTINIWWWWYLCIIPSRPRQQASNRICKQHTDRGEEPIINITSTFDTTHRTSHNTSHHMTHHTKHPSIIHAVVLNQVLWNSMIHSSLPCTLPSPGLESEAPEILIWGDILPLNSGCSTAVLTTHFCNDATVLLKIPKHHSCLLLVIQNNHKGRLCQQN